MWTNIWPRTASGSSTRWDQGVCDRVFQCCRSGSWSEFSFWCRSGSGSASKRCRSTRRFIPKFYTCWKLGGENLLYIRATQLYKVFFFSSNAPLMCHVFLVFWTNFHEEIKKNTCAWNQYRSGSACSGCRSGSVKMMRIRPDPDPQHLICDAYVQPCGSASFACGSGSCPSDNEVQFLLSFLESVFPQLLTAYLLRIWACVE